VRAEARAQRFGGSTGLRQHVLRGSAHFGVAESPQYRADYEVGGDEQDCFLAMEFLRGRSYAHLQRLSSAEPGDYRVDLEVMLATLSGLEHAHQRRDLAGEPMRLVHRDVSRRTSS